MDKIAWRQGALDHLHLGTRAGAEQAGVTLGVLDHGVCVNLRGAAAEALLEAVSAVCGFVLPLNAGESAEEGAYSAFWLGPDEWLLIGPDQGSRGGTALIERLDDALPDGAGALTDVSESYARIRISGPAAQDALAKGCRLDLDQRCFVPGQVMQTLLGRADVILHRIAAESFDILVRRSFAEYLWLWLEDAAREYGVAVAQ